MTQDAKTSGVQSSPKITRRSFGAVAFALLSAGALLGGLRPAAAETYPSRQVRIIVPFVAGGAPDITARIIADALTKELGQRFLVENVAGGGTVIGTTQAAKAKPDGYTLLFASNSLALIPSLRKNLPYDTVKDLSGVAMVARQPFAMVVTPSFKAKSVQELLDMAKAQPDGLRYASSGAGTGNHLVTEQFLKMTGVKIKHVPYQGTGQALVDVMAGRVDMIITTASSLYSSIESGQLRALGVGETEELPQLPGIPPIAKTVPGFNETSWGGFVIPAGTPPEIIKQLNEAIVKATQSPEVRTAMEKIGAIPKASTPKEFEAFIQSEIVKWKEVIELTGLEIN